MLNMGLISLQNICVFNMYNSCKEGRNVVFKDHNVLVVGVSGKDLSVLLYVVKVGQLIMCFTYYQRPMI